MAYRKEPRVATVDELERSGRGLPDPDGHETLKDKFNNIISLATHELRKEARRSLSVQFSSSNNVAEKDSVFAQKSRIVNGGIDGALLAARILGLKKTLSYTFRL
jgi:hypothetical protein